MFLTTLILIGATCVLLWRLLNPSRYHKLLAKIPGPSPVPIFGNALQLKSDPEEYFSQLTDFCDQYEKTTPVFKLVLGHQPFVYVTQAATAEQCLGSMKNISKASNYQFMHPWLQTGLLTSTGEKWQSRRKLLTKTFHFRILTDFLDVFNEQSQVLVDVLKEKCDQGEFDVFPFITMCALDIICETAMGKKINAQLTGGNSDYVTAVTRMSELVVSRGKSPWQWMDFVFNLTSDGKEQAACLKTLHDFTSKVIDERMHEMEETPDVVDDNQNAVNGEQGLKKKRVMAFLDLLIHMSKEADFSRNDIQEEVDTFMFEGHDTTAAAMVWAIQLIGSHPEVQKKLHEEMDEIFGDSDRPATMADIAYMKYLECVIKESLRLYPSVTEVERLIEEELEIDGVTIPKGANLVVFIWRINRDPKCWTNPNKFDPDRFSKENAAGRHPYAFIPFSAGPRNCIGQKFALAEEKCVLSTLLRSFTIESVQRDEDTHPISGLVLRPLHGIRVRLSQREDRN